MGGGILWAGWGDTELLTIKHDFFSIARRLLCVKWSVTDSSLGCDVSYLRLVIRSSVGLRKCRVHTLETHTSTERNN